ncbi:MAG: CDP-alcohol phosphatidyltransferase family protein [Crocinitomicaceae bacterium]|nr:CDP-alcohol phosphatidyltransferase family protein [Crocinitomicaceae bacterium]
MISIYNIKPKFQQALQPFLLTLNRLGVRPNQITNSAIGLSFFLGLILFLFSESSTVYFILPFGLLLRMMLNALDGMMARQYNQKSAIGEVLNELGDVVSDLFIFIPFAFVTGLNPILIWLFALGSVINEFSGILAKVVSGNRRYDGPMGKSDRAFLIGAIALMMGFQLIDVYWINGLFLLAFLLTLLSSFLRILNALK